MARMDIEKILQALEVLETEGRKAYKAEYQEAAPAWRCYGQALAAVGGSPREILFMAYEALEDMNAHGINSVIDLVAKLYGPPYHVSDVERWQRMINRNGLQIQLSWDRLPAGDYPTKRVNLRLIVEDVKADE